MMLAPVIQAASFTPLGDLPGGALFCAFKRICLNLNGEFDLMVILGLGVDFQWMHPSLLKF